ncbi:MAG TPA: hypothetical protein VE753_04760 [Gaiellaceae bacterium]|jgi:hypothetical protein|nr:hypothetical protein [Gaiellaceae bacterium]
MRWLGVVLALAAVALPGAAPASGEWAGLHLRLVASGLDEPTFACPPRSEPGRL